MKTINGIDFKGKRVLVRVDFNVPLNEKNEPTDLSRITAAIPTIKMILSQGGRLILMSHVGRPKNGPEDKFSLKHICKSIEELSGAKVNFINDCIGEDVEKATKSLKQGEILLLENLRFYTEETAGDIPFAEKLAKNGDIYVNDAFGTAHRAHASTAIIARYFPSDKYFGSLMFKEIENVGKLLNANEKPVLAIVGGAKVSSKISILKNLIPTVDRIIIGGGMAYTFAKAMGGKVGSSLVEDDYLETAKQIVQESKENNVELIIPVDSLNADSFSNEANISESDIMNVPDGLLGLDIGPKSLKLTGDAIRSSKTILWNGPLGVFEMSNFSKGTINAAEAIKDATANGAFSLVGGGDSVAAVKQFGYANDVSYVSTGGGAMLEYLEGKVLPGIQAIMD